MMAVSNGLLAVWLAVYVAVSKSPIFQGVAVYGGVYVNFFNILVFYILKKYKNKKKNKNIIE